MLPFSRFSNSTSTALALALILMPAAAQARRHGQQPAPTATPTPTPSPGPITAAGVSTAAALAPTNSTLDDLTVSQVFPAWQSTVKYSYPASGSNAGKPSGFGNFAKATSSVRYDAATNSYTIRDTGNASATSTFGPANVVAAESDASHTVYRKSGGGTTETLTMLNPGAANPLIALTYASYGHWRKTTPGAAWNGDTGQSDTWFVYGIKTSAAQMPRTGSASYMTVLDGTFADKTALYAVSGTGSILADFGAGSLGFSATALGTPESGPLLDFGTITGTGSIKTNSASFSAKGSAGGYKMDMSGYFFGPAAEEVGAVFRLSGNGGNGTGAVVGKQ